MTRRAKMSNTIEVSVIIINYNSSHYTLQCVDSIIKHSLLSAYEIIIVDNNSTEEDYYKLYSLKTISRISVIRSKINLGFSGGNMFGVQHASQGSIYYYFLNNDCQFLSDNISILANFLKNNPKTGIATPQMYSDDLKIQPSFGYYPSIGDILLGHGFMRWVNPMMYPSQRKEYHLPVSVPYATGSAMFVRVDYFALLGGFDTNYFLYCEEEDLCMGMRRKGWEINLVPEAKFIHYGGGSTKRNLAIEKEFYISYLYFIRKFYSPPQRLLLQLLYSLKLLRKFYKSVNFFKLAFFIFRGAPLKESLKFEQIINLND
jgi:GT2 family glycosyltransferase